MAGGGWFYAFSADGNVELLLKCDVMEERLKT